MVQCMGLNLLRISHAVVARGFALHGKPRRLCVAESGARAESRKCTGVAGRATVGGYCDRTGFARTYRDRAKLQRSEQFKLDGFCDLCACRAGGATFLTRRGMRGAARQSQPCYRGNPGEISGDRNTPRASEEAEDYTPSLSSPLGVFTYVPNGSTQFYPD